MAVYDPLTDWPAPEYYAKFTDEYLYELRAKWNGQHVQDGNTAGYTDEPLKILGLKGEVEFARIHGLIVDEDYYRDGDGGIDFLVPFGSIDVKTTRARPWSALLHKQDKPIADIIVLQLYDEEDRYFHRAGWTTGSELLRAAKMSIHWNGMVNKNLCMEIHQLRKMGELNRMFKAHRQP